MNRFGLSLGRAAALSHSSACACLPRSRGALWTATSVRAPTTVSLALATSLRFCASTGGSGTTKLPSASGEGLSTSNVPAPLPDATPIGNDPATVSSSATKLSDADKEIVRKALEIDHAVRLKRQQEDKELEEKAKAMGKQKWELEKEIAESGQLLRDKDRKDMMGGQGIGTKHGDMMAIFTCNVCEHRSAKRFSKHCYTKGVVIVQCPGCTSRHLLADNLGWFEDEKKNIEEILRERGEDVVKVSASIFIETVSATTTVADPTSKGAA